MKHLLIVLALFAFSCSSEDDPQPQVSCEQLKSEIDIAQKNIQTHQAEGSNGNPDAWKKELDRLMDIKTVKSNEYARRAC